MNQRINEYNQPIGEAMPGWQKRALPEAMYYVGKYTIVTKLTCEHSKALYECFNHSSPSNWTYLPEEPPQNDEEFEKMLLRKIASKTEVFYVVLSKQMNQPFGIFSLMRIDQENGVMEVGHINFSDALRKTRLSTEAHYLLASYVFDELQYRRYEWKCDSLNAPSIQAAERLGFQYEGTFRNNVIYKQRSRNTS
ncbi:GNAT family N-acetyltransferase [Oceanobacillus sp. CFH 90083]|uniref:GNAT family N-acetyltransferase n=1 Tax=Oceanobacillus sp. CFH 90083 TaxID=2592336 RepID=UPI001D132E87|nr:GNAT family protein [Oceanobacillus sp. CFH 90083]